MGFSVSVYLRSAIALPEIFVAIMIMVFMLVDAFTKSSNRRAFSMMIFTLLASMALQCYSFYLGSYNTMGTVTHPYVMAFNDMFILDNLAFSMKMATYIVTAIIVIYSDKYLNDRLVNKYTFYTVFLFAMLGMQVMISANSLLIIYLGVELYSLSLYSLVAFKVDNKYASEASMKYFVLGALASGILLYGISLIYGATGHLEPELIFKSMYTGNVNNYLAIFGLVFIVSGLMFKLGLVPFHAWVPDTYQASMLPVTTILGTVSKLAAVVFVIRVLYAALIFLHQEWSAMLLIMGWCSLFIGNIVAINQTNIKRMLGYSNIAHMGFIALGLLTASAFGLSSVLFYVVAYVLTSVAGFGLLLILSRNGFECENIADLEGLNKSHPIYAFIMMLVMLSLAGIPPMIGFYAKFTILSSLVEIGYIKTAVFAVMMSLIGAFYYLRVIKVMYFGDINSNIATSSDCTLSKSLLLINALALLIFGIMPQYVINYCTHMIIS